jgi:hypothetical protein
METQPAPALPVGPGSHGVLLKDFPPKLVINNKNLCVSVTLWQE